MQTGSAPATGTGRVANTVRGTGAPVLVLHGTPGSLEGAEAMARFLPSDRFRVVAVARPGYAGTPIIPGHASLDDEADRYARSWTTWASTAPRCSPGPAAVRRRTTSPPGTPTGSAPSS